MCRDVEINNKENEEIVRMVFGKIIYGNSVDMRSATIEDLEFTYEIRQDKERTKYMHPVDGGIEAQEKWLRRQFAEPGDYFFIVCDKSGNSIGTNAVYQIDEKKHEGLLGRTLLNGNPIQNYEALIMIYEFAFYTLHLDKVKADILEENKASTGVTKHLGGREKEKIYDKELGRNMIRFEIKKDDYEKKREQLHSILDRFAGR